MDDLLKAHVSKNREVKEPGKLGGKFEYNPKSGLIRYLSSGKSYPVPHLTVEPTHEFSPVSEEAAAHGILGLMGIHTAPKALEVLTDYATKMGHGAGAESVAKDILLRMGGKGVSFHPDMDKGVADSASAAQAAAQKMSKQGQKIWNKCKVLIPPETKPPKSYGVSFAYAGKTYKVKGLREQMIRALARIRVQCENSPKRMKKWNRICKNFSIDFSDAMGFQLDASKLKLDAVIKSNEKIKAIKKPKKAKVAVSNHNTEPHKFGWTDTQGWQPLNRDKLPGANIYVGTTWRGDEIGRWVPAVKQSDCAMNSSVKPKGWKGEHVTKKDVLWVVKWPGKLGIHGQDDHPSAESTTIRWDPEKSAQGKKNKKAKFEVVHALINKLPEIHDAYMRDLKDSDPAKRQMAFMIMLMDTMHARSGIGGSKISTGVVQFTPKHLHRDGTYKFYAKDGVFWDSDFTTTLPLTGEKVGMNRAGGDKGLAGIPGAQAVYDELVVGKGPNDRIFDMKVVKDYNQWIKRVTGIKKVTAHKFRHAYGTSYFIEEWHRGAFQKKVKALQKAGDQKSLSTYVDTLVTHCSELAAVKLGHRKTVAKKKPGTKSKKTTSAKGLGAGTTRKSYLDFHSVYELTKPYSVVPGGFPESKPEKKRLLGVKKSISSFEDWIDVAEPLAFHAVTPEPPPDHHVLRSDHLRDRWKVARAYVAGELEDETETDDLFQPVMKGRLRLIIKADSLAERYGRPMPLCRYCNRQAPYVIITQTREKVPVCKIHLKAKGKMQKAILTKPSEQRERKGKPAPTPSKAGAKFMDPKTGKQRYQYGAQAGGSKKPNVPKAMKPPEGPPPPPKIHVEELANALKTTTGALKQYAAQFPGVKEFTAHFHKKAGQFLAKHRVGDDKLRRLYETLREGDTQAPRV